MPGPLAGLRIIEMGGIGPAPFAAMLLADHGAEVIRVDRPQGPEGVPPLMLRSRKMLRLDLKNDDDRASFKRLVATADGLIEGFRPGTMERLGLGPDTLCADSSRLVYGRMTGWGQKGPYAPFAGHDINYIALSGAAHICGPESQPLPPPALIGDMGGGGMFLAFSMLSGLLHVQRGGTGQVIDCAMTNGSALLMTMIHGFRADGQWADVRASNLLDGGAHFYGIYPTADGRFVAIGAIEPQFYKLFLERMGLAEDGAFCDQMTPARWPALRARLSEMFLTRTRDAWCAILEHSDVCFAPVLDLNEAPAHPQNVASGMFIRTNGVVQPAPGPHFSHTMLAPPEPPAPVFIGDLL